MRVLIVEDDEKIAGIVANGLRESGFECDIVGTGDEGIRSATSRSYEIVILDLMLPVVSGLRVIQEIRASGLAVPILILSAKRSVEERVQGLQAGADDYMVKPFAFVELLARVHALRRRAVTANEQAKLSVGEFTLDLLAREAFRLGKKLNLQKNEFNLLEYFLRNRGQILTKSQILERIWNYNFDPQTNVVDVLVCRLRNKIDKDFHERSLRTVRGLGYVFEKNI